MTSTITMAIYATPPISVIPITIMTGAATIPATMTIIIPAAMIAPMPPAAIRATVAPIPTAVITTAVIVTIVIAAIITIAIIATSIIAIATKISTAHIIARAIIFVAVLAVMCVVVACIVVGHIIAWVVANIMVMTTVVKALAQIQSACIGLAFIRNVRRLAGPGIAGTPRQQQ
jgi:hypothetical protein